MPTVAHTIEELLRDKPFVQEAMRRGIINHAALAESLIPDVEKILRKKVTFSAANMAVRRLAEKLEGSSVERTMFDATSDISVRSHLVEITLYKEQTEKKKLKELYDILPLERGDFLTITQGLHETMIITSAKYAEKVTKHFPKEAIRKTITNLSSITVHISPKATQSSGMFYIVTRALAWENVNIIDIVSTYTELTVLVNENDTGRAFDILKNVIASTT